MSILFKDGKRYHLTSSISILLMLVVHILTSNPCFSKSTFGLDTINLKPQEAEQLFLENNLLLLASQLQIDQAEAMVVQAKAWPNPSFSLSGVQISTRKDTDPSPGIAGSPFWENRTFTAEIEQVIQLAGKRRKHIAFEKQQKEISIAAFSDLLNSVKTAFRKELADLSYYQKLVEDLRFQKDMIDQLVRSQEIQYEDGNTSKVHLFRFKALQISLHSEINELLEKISTQQQILKSMMAISPDKYILLEDEIINLNIHKWKDYALSTLLSMSEKANARLNQAESEIKASSLAWKMEKANAVPDISLNLNYDRAGANHLDFIGAGISIDLPIFNRNKGNIKKAQFEVQKTQLLKRDLQNNIQNQIIKHWHDLQQNINLYEEIDLDYMQEINGLSKSISQNFMDKNMELLVFLDFIESFRESKKMYYEVIRNIQFQQEELNYLIGQDL